MAPFSPHVIGRSHMRSLGNSHTGEFDNRGLCCVAGITCFVSMETDAGVGYVTEQRAPPTPRMSGQHAY